jgi:hypothetical protein
MNRHRLRLICTAAAMLSVASAIVTLKGASDEPYSSFRASDALVQIGLGMVLMLLWLQFAAFLVWTVVTRRASKWWLALLLWIALCEFILLDAPVGYVQDILKFGAVRH